MKKTVLLFILISGMFYGQKLDLQALQSFIGKSPNEFAKAYNLTKVKDVHNFWEIKTSFSGLPIDDEESNPEIIHVNNVIKEITIYKENDFKTFFANTLKKIDKLQTDDNKKFYKVESRYDYRTNYFGKVSGFIDALKSEFDLENYNGIATVITEDREYEMMIFSVGIALTIK